MSKQPAVKAKTSRGITGSRPPRKVNQAQDGARASSPQAEATEDATANDEEIARQLQERLLSEQEESDAEMARRLQEEERSKHRVAFIPANMSGMRPGARPMSATPIHALFHRLFGMTPQSHELEIGDDDDEDDTPAMDPDRDSLQPEETQGASGSRPSGVTTNTRITGSRNRLPRQLAGRSPDRARGGNRSPERPVRGSGAGTTPRQSGPVVSPDNPEVPDLLPGVRPNPIRPVIRPRRTRGIMLSARSRDREGGADQAALRPIAPPGRLLLGPRENTLDLPPGELEPDAMVLDTRSPNDVSREDDFISMMRDPFLLLLLLSTRNPDVMVPDDIDIGDYESLWNLAERLGEVRSRGMSEEDISRLPTRTFRRTDKEEMCSICLSEFKSGEKVQLLPCEHEYHHKCLLEWLKRNATCPVCRQSVKKEDR